MKKERLLYLDVIRTIAVICVFTCHYTRALEAYGIGYAVKVLPDFPCSLYLGSFGVSLFFIVSGVSLMYVYGDECKLFAFYKKRFLSIFPMFWLAYGCAFLFNFWINRGFAFTLPKARLLLTLFGMDGYLGWYWPNYYLLGEWFLGCLIFMYILFPLLRKGVKDYPIITGIILLVIYIGGSILVTWKGTKMPIECWFFLRIPEMAFGMYFIRYIKQVRLPAFLVSVVVLIVSNIWDFHFVPVIYWTPFIGICAFLAITYVSKWLDFRLIRGITGVVGKYSYAIFLTHHFIIEKVAARFCAVYLSRLGVYCLYIIIVILVAFISWLLYHADNRIRMYIFTKKKKEVAL